MAGAAKAQISNGTIAGVVRDPVRAAVPGAHVKVANLATNLGRDQPSTEQGDYSFPALAPEEYEISVEARQFQRVLRRATVETGMTVSVDFDLQLGNVTESVTVGFASPQIRYDSHFVSGTITPSEIGSLPINGRNFLELAKLEPGVQPPTHTSGNRMLIPVLGAPGGPSGRGTSDGGRGQHHGGQPVRGGNGVLPGSRPGIPDFDSQFRSLDGSYFSWSRQCNYKVGRQ